MLVFKEQGNISSGYFTKDLNMQGFATGVYVVSLVTEKEVLNKKFVRE